MNSSGGSQHNWGRAAGSSAGNNSVPAAPAATEDLDQSMQALLLDQYVRGPSATGGPGQQMQAHTWASHQHPPTSHTPSTAYALSAPNSAQSAFPSPSPPPALSPAADAAPLAAAAAGHEEAVPYGSRTITIVQRPWHLLGSFSSIQSIELSGNVGLDHWKHVVVNDPTVHSIEPEHMAQKYGRWYLDTHKINRCACIGIGSTAAVYAGKMLNQPMAYKVMNLTKTAPNAGVFLEHSVLTELEVHQLLLAWRTDPAFVHLLGIVDCIMYPPFHAIYSIADSFDRCGAEPPAPAGTTTIAPGAGDAAGDADVVAKRSISELKFQVIMVTRMCEMGGLFQLCQGKTKLPTASMCPESLRDVLAALPDEHYAALLKAVKYDLSGLGPADVRARFPVAAMSFELMSTWGRGHKAYMRAADLSGPWLLVLKLQILIQVTEGLALLHKAGVIHCDIKLDNVFLTMDLNASPFRISSKLGDLGMCRYLDPSRHKPKHISVTGLTSAYTTLVKGTPGYCAPEMMERGRIAPETDIYSFSVLCAVALSEKSTFVRHESGALRLSPSYHPAISQHMANILTAGMSPDPAQRPKLQAIRQALQMEMRAVAGTIAGFTLVSAPQ